MFLTERFMSWIYSRRIDWCLLYTWSMVCGLMLFRKTYVSYLLQIYLRKRFPLDATCSCRNQIKKQFIREFITLISERTFSINFKDLRFWKIFLVGKCLICFQEWEFFTGLLVADVFKRQVQWVTLLCFVSRSVRLRKNL